MQMDKRQHAITVVRASKMVHEADKALEGLSQLEMEEFKTIRFYKALFGQKRILQYMRRLVCELPDLSPYLDLEYLRHYREVVDAGPPSNQIPLKPWRLSKERNEIRKRLGRNN